MSRSKGDRMTIARKGLLTAALATAATVSLIGAGPAMATKNCGSAHYPSNKGGYFAGLKVTGISCAGGRDVERGHYRCRTKHGIQGKCPSFSGWHCTEFRPASGRDKVEYNARVTCKKGNRRVVFAYQQNI